MATRVLATPVSGGAEHESFLRYARFRWLKIAIAASLLALAGYLLADVKPRPSGGSWYGYTLGTLGVLQILWLTLLGVRKRNMTRGRWSLKAWTSAHVYLGLSLIVVATLHTGFQLGWNIHTLAYVLMLVVILSGLFGVCAYASCMTPRSRSISGTPMSCGSRSRTIRSAAERSRVCCAATRDAARVRRR